eukprot:scaffold284020_cov36-Tisochrysis_lutea.AAC.2
MSSMSDTCKRARGARGKTTIEGVRVSASLSPTQVGQTSQRGSRRYALDSANGCSCKHGCEHKVVSRRDDEKAVEIGIDGLDERMRCPSRADDEHAWPRIDWILPCYKAVPAVNYLGRRSPCHQVSSVRSASSDAGSPPSAQRAEPALWAGESERRGGRAVSGRISSAELAARRGSSMLSSEGERWYGERQ